MGAPRVVARGWEREGTVVQAVGLPGAGPGRLLGEKRVVQLPGQGKRRGGRAWAWPGRAVLT